jgi:hypothetical protein
MNQQGTGRGRIDRRTFLRGAAAVAGSALIPACAGREVARIARPRRSVMSEAERLIFVAIDSLHPATLRLDSHGRTATGGDDWLMPNVRRFVDRSTSFPNAKCFLPSATDMNHVNAIAGTCSGQTGILGVYAQLAGWDAAGAPIVGKTSLTVARDDLGRPLDTLFHAWKRKFPDSPTAFVSGKGWVADLFDGLDPRPVDHLVTGRRRPEYLDRPRKARFADPPTDADAACDPESKTPLWVGRGRAADFATRVCQGQDGLLTRILERTPDRYPHDEWIVGAALEVFAREDPGLAYLLLAQADDAGHAIGAAWDPEEFAAIGRPPRRRRGCPDNEDYALASRRNALMLREGILDAMRDVDIQFGRLLAGLAEMGIADRATIVLLSDHAMENYYRFGSLAQTDLRALIQEAGLAGDDELYVGTVCSYALVHWREDPSRAARAKAVLEAHRVRNPLTGVDECPWWVVGRDGMKAGVPGIALPGELYHPYFAGTADAALWPDLFVLGKTGWQLPVYAGRMPNTGAMVPKWMPPFLPFNGGHGSVDTLPIVAAILRPGGTGRVVGRAVRIADLAVTAAARFGLTLRSTTIGRDLTGDLA